jgi:amino acid adenylation domain-containing protein
VTRIVKNIEGFYPLSSMQEGMLFHSLYSPGSGVYCDQGTYVLEGELDSPTFQRAWQRVVDRHAVLRTAFVWEGLKEPLQVVRQQASLPLEVLDWQGLSPDEQQERLTAYLRHDRERGFELASAPLMRLALIRKAEGVHCLVQSWHHLILDGWSEALVRREFLACYEAMRQGREITLERSRPFKEYIKWLRQQDLSRAEEYWRNALKGFVAPTALRAERLSGGSINDVADYGDQEISVSPALASALKAFARRHRLTLNTVVQGAWALLLARYSGEEDVLFGATVSGRPAALDGVESMVGVFLNTLPVRVSVLRGDPLVPWLRQVQTQLVGLRQFEHTPLLKVQKWSDAPRGLFDSILVFENFPTESSAGSDRSLKVSQGRYLTRTNYPLTVIVVPEPDFTVRLLYERSRFDDSAMTRMLGQVQTLLDEFVADPDRSLGNLSLLPAAERRQVLQEFNNTRRDFSEDKRLHEWIEAQAERTPDAVAVTCDGRSLTYRELNIRANQLAHHLRQLGVRANVIVAVCAERSIEMVIGLYGILKAGGAYVPLDPGFPRDRLAFMAADAGLTLIVTTEALRHLVPEARCASVCLDSDWDRIRVQSWDNPERLGTVDDIAYVLYTSGSTGKPKGVEIPHRALANFLRSMRAEPGCTERDVLLAVTTLSFDIAGLELYLPLIAGGRVVLASQMVAADGHRLRELLEACGATLMQATPATWRMLIEAGWEGTPGLTALCGGEGLPRELAGQLLERTAALWNMYGPTETTIWSSIQRIRPDDCEITIGRPIANTEFYVLDPHRQPLPIGVPGELYIGGQGLARGYRNQPALTADRFVPHPFSTEAGARLYRTGDLCRYRADGQVVHLGRLDHQVKLRGFRIELGEIEAALDQHPAVQQSVVVARTGAGGSTDTFLAAYVVAQPGGMPPVGELRRFLQEKLPDYMVPSAFVRMDVLPLTPNGKVDRRALPEPDVSREALESPYVAPRTPTEETLAGIWKEVLKVEQVGVHDNFFDLGGHSLSAVRLIAEVEKQLGIRLPLSTLFVDGATIGEQSKLVQRGRVAAHRWTPIVPLQPGGSRPPFFLVHGIGGEVLSFSALVRRLGPDQGFFGLQADTGIGPAFFSNVKDVASRYLDAVCSKVTSGPYRIGGYCSGGVIAYEMAQQLRAAGRDVALLVMLDTAAPDGHGSGPLTLRAAPQLVRNIMYWPVDDDFLASGPRAQLARLGGKLRLWRSRAWALLRREQETVDIRDRFGLYLYPESSREVLEAHARMLAEYRPRPYAGTVTLLRSRTTGFTYVCAAPDLGWRALAADVDVRVVRGAHDTILREPWVAELAAALDAALVGS